MLNTNQSLSVTKSSMLSGYTLAGTVAPLRFKVRPLQLILLQLAEVIKKKMVYLLVVMTPKYVKRGHNPLSLKHIQMAPMKVII